MQHPFDWRLIGPHQSLKNNANRVLLFLRKSGTMCIYIYIGFLIFIPALLHMSTSMLDWDFP